MVAGSRRGGACHGGFGVDTEQGGTVESPTAAREARSDRVTDDERETQHLPAPSLWPIGFAIGVACILVGLVVSVPALIVGAIIALVFGFLWVRDLFVQHPVTSATDMAATPATAPLMSLRFMYRSPGIVGWFRRRSVSPLAPAPDKATRSARWISAPLRSPM